MASYSFYPEAPQGIPSNLTVPSTKYRRQVILVLGSIILFVLFYLAMVVGMGYLAYWSFMYPVGKVDRGTIFLKIAACTMSVMIFLFLLKGLFKRQQRPLGEEIEITEDNEPDLHAFIHQLCKDTNAPFPKKIIVTPEVNAAVFYDSSLLSLFWPVRKNLLIGLGLINTLTLSEFKAVLAHEFGHFSQSSMRLGSYVYVANNVLTDMVYGRDYWDDVLRVWRSLDLRISIFAWAIFLVVWVLRKFLSLVFRIINMGHMALSRQMEFHADLVAVSVTGSDSLINALYRLDLANQSLNLAIRDIQDASDHKLFTSDLFYHQTHAITHLRQRLKDPRAGIPPDLPENTEERVQIFEPGKNETPTMWATHPSNYEREENAKRLYFRSIDDDRSAWVLFRNREALCKKVTGNVYSLIAPNKDITMSPPEKVQEFIDAEYAETTYNEKYHGLYDNRFLSPGNIDTIESEVIPGIAQLRDQYQSLYHGELREKLDQYRHRLNEFNQLFSYKQNLVPIPGKGFTFREQTYYKRDVDQLYEQLDKELIADEEWLGKIDQTVFRFHYFLAWQLKDGTRDELLSRYRFHMAIQSLQQNLNKSKVEVDGVLNFLAGNPELSQEDLKYVIDVFRRGHAFLRDGLNDTSTLQVPKLSNMPEDLIVADFLLEDPLVDALAEKAKSVDGKWIDQFLKQMALVMDRLRRINAKSLGGILALQETIASQIDQLEITENDHVPTEIIAPYPSSSDSNEMAP